MLFGSHLRQKNSYLCSILSTGFTIGSVVGHAIKPDKKLKKKKKNIIKVVINNLKREERL